MRTLCALAAFLAVASPAGASTLVLNEGAGNLRDGYTFNSLYAGTLGAQFTVGPNPVLVSDLGYFDGPNSAAGANGDGLLQSHEVGIFATNVIVPGADVIVPAGGGTPVGNFRYVHLAAPVTLTAGATYTIGGQVTAADQNASGDVFKDINNSQTLSADFSTSFTSKYTGTSSGNGSFNDGVFRSPQDSGSTNQIYLGPNLQYSVVPEPASLLILSLAVASLLFIAARSRRSGV